MADAFLTEAAFWGQRPSVRTRPAALAAAGHRGENKERTAKDRMNIMHFRRQSCECTDFDVRKANRYVYSQSQMGIFWSLQRNTQRNEKTSKKAPPLPVHPEEDRCNIELNSADTV